MTTPAPDVNTIVKAANAIFRSIPGIRRVYDEQPNVFPTGDLPCVIPVVEGLQHSFQANGYQRKDYTVTFLLLVAPGASRDLPSLESQARPYGDLVADAFFQHVKLNTSEIDHAFMESGSYSAITLTNKTTLSYVGWVFTLKATLKQVLDQDF